MSTRRAHRLQFAGNYDENRYVLVALLEQDISRFGQLGVIASMQGIHCTSDAPYVIERLGAKRAEEGFGAYIVFGVIDRAKKDAAGSAALDENNVVCQLLRETTKRKIPMAAISTSELSAKYALNRYVIDQCFKRNQSNPLSPVFKHVAHAPHVVNQLAAIRIIDLCTQAANGDVDHIRIAVEVHVPNLLRDKSAR